MIVQPHNIIAIFAVLFIVTCVTPAHADAIDGTWCSPAGEQVTIAGENVTTPGGNQIKGNYTRHTMTFKIPRGESGAGNTLHMEQLHEGAVKVTTIQPIQIEPGAHEDWTRCQPGLS